MGKYNGAVVTTAGQNVIAQAITGTKLTWTVMRTSSVAIPQGTDLTTLTSLSGIEQTSKITDASVYGNNVIQLSSRFSNTGIATVYYIQTVGIYGQLAGGAETLIAVMTAVTPDEMPVYDPDSPSAFIFNTQITVQNADAVTMTVNDTGTATVADLNRKVDINGGDVSDTVVNTVTASTAEYPVPSAGDSVKTIIGKITKFCADIMNTFTGATSSAIGKKGLVPAPSAGQQTAYMRGDGTWVQPQNNATTTQNGYVLDAKMGKTLQDQITSLNDSLAPVIVYPNSGKTLLEIIVEAKETRKFPFAMQKFGDDKLSDAPNETTEFNAIIFGYGYRWTILLVNYGRLGNRCYLRNGYGESWTELNWNTLTYDKMTL